MTETIPLQKFTVPGQYNKLTVTFTWLSQHAWIFLVQDLFREAKC